LRPRGEIILKWFWLQKYEEEERIQVARTRFNGGIWRHPDSYLIVALTVQYFNGGDDEYGMIWKDADVISLQEIRLDGLSKIT